MRVLVLDGHSPELFSKVSGFQGFGTFFKVDDFRVGNGSFFSLLGIVINLLEDSENVDNIADLITENFALSLFLIDEATNFSIVEVAKYLANEGILDQELTILLIDCSVFFLELSCLKIFLLDFLFDIFTMNSELLGLSSKQFNHILTDDNPEESWLTFIQELPVDFIVVSFEIAESQSHTFAIDLHQDIEWVVLLLLPIFFCIFMISVNEETELSLLNVLFGLEESSHVGDIFKEG